jgi:outer membrane lipoprotein SlyB
MGLYVNLDRRIISSAFAGVSLLLTTLLPAMALSAPAHHGGAHNASAKTPYARGYQQAYAEAYLQGKADFTANVPRDFEATRYYQERQNHYDPPLAQDSQYRDGFDLGFELGYSDGYLGRVKSAQIPSRAQLLAARNARQRSIAQAPQSNAPPPNQAPPQYQQQQQQQQPYVAPTQKPAAPDPLDIPNDTEIRLKLTSPIDTRTSHIGDKFTAEVISPAAYESATIYGHISALEHSGRVSGKTTVSLAFDSITLQDGRSAHLDAQLIKIYESQAVKKVDEEGHVETADRTRDSEVRGAIGAAAGAVIGGIAGGGRGAFVGLILGGAAGVGTVYVEGSKDLILDRGTEMLIRVEQTRRPRGAQ